MIIPFIDWPDIHAKKQGSVLTFFLRIVSFIYGLAILLRLIFYRIGIFRSKSLPCYVVSIGNMTTGGTGKTPYVVMLAEWAVEKRFSAVILSRGYKRKRSKNSLIVSDGEKLLASADDAGDEPYLLAKKLPSVPVLVSKKRYEIGYWAARLFKPELVLLDDGYQHLSLNRDLNILLIDAKRRFGNEFLIPRGPLREPVEQIKRADIIIITRCADGDSGEDVSDFLKKNFPEKTILRSGYFSDQIVFPVSGKSCKPEVLKGKRVAAFAGVAYPEDFLGMLKDLGAQIIRFKAFPDHHPFSEHDIAEFTSWAGGSDVDFLLTTEKDWVRLEGKIDPGLNIAVLAIKIGLLSDEDALFDTISQGILGYRDRESESQVQTY